MKCFFKYLGIGVLSFSQAALAQVLPDTLLRADPSGVRVWEVLPDRLLRLRTLLQPVSRSDIRFFFTIVVDPRTGEVWSPQHDGGYPSSIARIEILGSQYRVAEEIPLPFSLAQVAGAGFDDDGYLVVCGTGGMIYTIDLEQRLIVRQICFCSGSVVIGSVFVSSYAPPRRNQPAVLSYNLTYSDWTHQQFLVSIGSNGAIVHEYARSLRGSNFQPMLAGIVTTSTGRTFLSGNSPSGQLAGLWEIDHALRRVIMRQHLSPIGFVSGIMEDPSREVLHLWHPGPFPHAHMTRGVFDLQTNTVVQQYQDLEAPNITLFQQGHAGWYPRDRVLASPINPQSGTNFDGVLSVGGDPGEAALLWFDRAELGGIPITGISTIVSVGLVDANGLFRTRLPYRPNILPLRPGDSLFFEGFTWNGSELARTGEVSLRWR